MIENVKGWRIMATQIVSLVAALLVNFGIDLTAEQQAGVVTAILVVANVVTAVLRHYTDTPPGYKK